MPTPPATIATLRTLSSVKPLPSGPASVEAIADAQRGELARALPDNEKHDACTVAARFVDAERGCRALAAWRNRHDKLPRLRHAHQLRRVKS